MILTYQIIFDIYKIIYNQFYFLILIYFIYLVFLKRPYIYFDIYKEK